MANKYLSLEGLQAYTKQLYINFPSSVEYDNTSGSEKFTYTTYTYDGDTKTASIHDIVTVADLKDDLALGNYAGVDTLTVGSGGTAVTATITDGTANIATLPADVLTGTTSTTLILGNGVTATTQNIGDNSTKVATTAYVDASISGITQPMQYKGGVTLSDTTLTFDNIALDATNGVKVGYTFKVTEDGTGVKAGDVLVAVANVSVTAEHTATYAAANWTIIPAGDDVDVTAVTAGTGLQVGDGTGSQSITSTGTINLKAATGSALGGVIVGNNIDVANDGTISVAVATGSVKGVV
jgi:hypothetical protein